MKFGFLGSIAKAVRPKTGASVAVKEVSRELDFAAIHAANSNNLLLHAFITSGKNSLKVINDALYIGNLAVKRFLEYIFDNAIAKALKLSGFAKTFFKRENFAKIKNFLSAEARLLPENHLHKVAKVKKVVIEKYPEIVEAAVKPEARSKFNWLVSSAKHIAKWVTFKKILVGAGMALTGWTAYEFIEAYRKRISGCMRHYVDPQTLNHTICRVNNGACNFDLPSKFSGAVPDCDINLILPLITNFNCADFPNKEPHCPHCDSSTEPLLSGGDSNVLYICSNPSFVDAAAEIVAKAGDSLINAVYKIGSTIVDNSINIFQVITMIIMGIIGVVGIGAAIYIIRVLNYITPVSEPSKQEDEQLLIDKINHEKGIKKIQ